MTFSENVLVKIQGTANALVKIQRAKSIEELVAVQKSLNPEEDGFSVGLKIDEDAESVDEERNSLLDSILNSQISKQTQAPKPKQEPGSDLTVEAAAPEPEPEPKLDPTPVVAL